MRLVIIGSDLGVLLLLEGNMKNLGDFCKIFEENIDLIYYIIIRNIFVEMFIWIMRRWRV